MIKIQWFLLLSIFFYSYSHAQSNIDSLQHVFDNENSDSIRLYICVQLLNELVVSDSTLAERYIQKGIAITERLKDEEKKLWLKTQRGVILYKKGKFEDALSIFKQILIQAKKDNLSVSMHLYNCIGKSYLYLNNPIGARKAFKKSLDRQALFNNHKQFLEAYLGIANSYQSERNYTRALEIYTQVIKKAEELDATYMIKHALNDIGTIYYYQGNYEAALTIYEKQFKIVNDEQNEEGIVLTLLNLGYTHSALNNMQKSISFFHQGLSKSKELKNKTWLATALNDLGEIYLSLNQEDSAIYYFNQFFSLCTKLKYNKRMITSLQMIGSWYMEKAKLSQSLNYYYKALEIVENANDTLGIAKIYLNLSSVYKLQKDYQQAIKFQHDALQYFTQLDQHSEMAKAHNNLASIHIKKQEYKTALQYGKKSFTTYQSLQDYCYTAHSLFNIGKAFLALQQQDSAGFFLQRSLQQANMCNQSVLMSSIYVQLGMLAMIQNDLVRSTNYYESALKYAKETNDTEALKTAAEYLYPIYKKRGQLEKAFATLEIYQANKDSLFNEENTRALVQKEMEYTLEKERQEQALQQAKQEVALTQQKWITYGVIGACLALFSIALAIYRNYRNKQKANQLLQAQNLAIHNQKEEITTQNETLQLQKDKLERLDQVKSRFFTNISHELRTPLTLISSPIQSLLHTTDESFQPKTIQQLEMMDRNTQQLKGLVNDIMDLSKLESEKLTLQEEPIEMMPQLSRIFSNFDSLAQHIGIEYTNELSTLQGVWLSLDMPKVERVLNNLLANALKHTPSTGSIKLLAKEQNRQLLIEVQDTGAGIAAIDLPHIFTRFFQSEQVDAPLQGGTGIGLALAKELTQLMGGKIEVNSEYGQGSTFSLLLPYTEVAAPSIAEPTTSLETEEDTISLAHLQPSEVSEKAFHVLIVEDHPDMQVFVKGLLDQRYSTHVAANGKEALCVLAQQHIDLIVSDVMMPEMDGYALLAHLKATEQLRGIPVVMLTALGDEAHKLQALTIGVDDYLSKPFSPQELLARVHNLLLRNEGRKTWQESEQQLEAPAEISPNKDVAPISLTKHDVEWLKEVELFLRQDLEQQQFLMTDVADHFHLSERQFRRRLKKITGLSPKKYQQEIALNQARELLEKGSYGNTTAVAYAIGMNHVTKFSKLYEARFGKKPSEYFLAVAI